MQARLHLELTQDLSSSEESIDQVRGQLRSAQVSSGFPRTCENDRDITRPSRSHSNIDNLRKEKKLVPPVKTVPNICKLT